MSDVLTEKRPSLLERVRPDGPARPIHEQDGQTEDAAPGAVVEPQHTADKHNRPKTFDSVRIHYGAGGSVSLAYAYVGAIDSPAPGKLVIEHAHRTVTIEGVRLERLHLRLEQRQLASLRETEHPMFQDGTETIVSRITVEKPT
jgi:hypothetical protein